MVVMNLYDSVCFIVPAYNEEDSLDVVLEELKEKGLLGKQVIVINDGSVDDTAMIAKKHGVILVSNKINSGVGYSIKRGLKKAYDLGFKIAIRIDGDGQHDLKSVEGLLNKLNLNRDGMVLGSRFHADNEYKTPLVRRISIWLLGGMIYATTGKYFKDPTSGYRAYGRRAMKQMATYQLPFFHEPTELALFMRDGFAVIEVSVKMRDRVAGRSSITLIKGLRGFWENTVQIWRLFFQPKRTKSKEVDAGGVKTA